MKRLFYLSLFVPVLFLSFVNLALSEEKQVVELITAEEAAAPDIDPSEFYIEAGRDEDNGPAIEVISPQRGASVKPPVPINVRFVKKEGKEIDISTFKVEYLKFIALDITSRVKDYVTKDGIKVPEVKLPSGTHTIRLSIGDNTGAVTKQVLTFEVL